MWRLFESVSRHIEHIEKPRIYHGEHCALCRIRNAKASSGRGGASAKEVRGVPTSRDLLVGPDRWTRRFVALEDPDAPPSALSIVLERRLLFTRVAFDGIDTVTPLVRVAQNSTSDDVIIILSPHPVPATDPLVVSRLCKRAHASAQLIFVWTTPLPPRVASTYIGRGISVVSVYQEGGRKLSKPDVSHVLGACLEHKHLRLSWHDLVVEMERRMPGWRVFSHNACGDDKRTFFGF